MHKKQNFLSVFLNGLIVENPTFVLMLGMCPTLGITTQAMNGVGMGLATTFVLVFSNLFISLLRNIIPEKVRIPSYIVIIASFVTLIDLMMQAFLPDLRASLGTYIPLITVNCIRRSWVIFTTGQAAYVQFRSPRKEPGSIHPKDWKRLLKSCLNGSVNAVIFLIFRTRSTHRALPSSTATLIFCIRSVKATAEHRES